jgi:hypothetical protein
MTNNPQAKLSLLNRHHQNPNVNTLKMLSVAGVTVEKSDRANLDICNNYEYIIVSVAQKTYRPLKAEVLLDYEFLIILCTCLIRSTCPSHTLFFLISINIWWQVQLMKLYITRYDQ